MVRQQIELPRQRTGSAMLQTSPTVSLSTDDSTRTTHVVDLSLLKHQEQTLIRSQQTLVSTSIQTLPMLHNSSLQPLQHRLLPTTSNVSVSCSLMVTLSVRHRWIIRQWQQQISLRFSSNQVDLLEATVRSKK